MELRFISGIGPARAALLAAAGYRDALDVLLRAPRPSGPPPPWCESGDLPQGQAMRVRARVVKTRSGFLPGRGRLLEARLMRADNHEFSARFFRATFLARRLLAGEWFAFEGRVDAKRSNLLNHPSFEHLPQGPRTPLPAVDGLRLVWRIPEGFGERGWTKLVDACLADPDLADPLGSDASAWRAVLHDLHRPGDATTFETARREVARRECLALAWRLQERRAAATAGAGTAWRWDDAINARALARLPFTLTAGQEAALAEIRADLQHPEPMYRLLAGDVGSGKTALCLVAALAVIADGGQAALLAPTAVLADQHARFIAACLAGSRVRTACLSGGTPAAERAAILAGLADGSLNLVIGTHALLDDAVRFARLGLAVIDEQHRFGTAQRAALVAKSPPGTRCDLLLTTATPIPRTLALTAYGDLAITRIAGRVPGRAPVATAVEAFAGWEALGAVLAAEAGRSFVVCPRIAGEDADDAPLDVGDAATAARKALGDDAVAVLTGDLPEARKLAALRAFADGAVRCLVATTVVEVGVDVPAATLAVVLDAQRFGLATLHQLRGRVGRGLQPGRCLLLHRTGDEALARLERLARSDDGLAVAEGDLAERGPGELLGLRQHGGFDLLATDLVRDLDLLQAAHATVRAALAAGGAMPAGLGRLAGDGGAAAG